MQIFVKLYYIFNWLLQTTSQFIVFLDFYFGLDLMFFLSLCLCVSMQLLQRQLPLGSVSVLCVCACVCTWSCMCLDRAVFL